jgi:hypothetical protein
MTLQLLKKITWNRFQSACLVIATVALAIYTYRLWYETHRLVVDSENTSAQQAQDTKASLALTKEVADAASRQAVLLSESNNTAKQTLVESSRVMSGQLNEMQKQSISADRSATANRAWLFVKFVSHTPVERTGAMPPRFVTDLVFTIYNAGQTPAVITKISAHMFWVVGTGDVPMILSSFEPDPIKDRSLGEAMLMGLTNMQTGEEYLHNMWFAEEPPKWNRLSEATNQVIIPAASPPNPITGRFLFQRAGISDANTQDAINFSQLWFYCWVTYKDVYGIDRDTSYYARLADERTAVAPKAERSKYNFMK